MSMQRRRISMFWLGVCLLFGWQGVVFAANPGVQGYCSVEKSLNTGGKGAFKDNLVNATAAFTAIKGILNAVYVIDLHRAHNAKLTEGVIIGVKPVEPMKRFFGPLKAFFLTVVPTLKVTNTELRRPRTWWVKLKQQTYGAGAAFKDGKGQLGSFDPIYSGYTNFYKGWMAFAALVTAYRLAALGVCKRATIFVPICLRKKKQCSMGVVDELPLDMTKGSLSDDVMVSADGQSCGATDEEKIAAFLRLLRSNRSALNKMGMTSKELGKFLGMWAPRLTTLKNRLNSIKSALGPVKSSMKTIASFLKPLHPAVKMMNKILDKKICVVKKVCFKVKQFPKQMKKLGGKLQKKAIKMIDKLYKPVVNKVLKKLPKPNLKGFEKAAKEFASMFSQLGAFSKSLEKLKKTPFRGFTSQLKSMDSKLYSAAR